MNMRKGNEKRSTKHRGEGEVVRAAKRDQSTTFQEEMHGTGNTGS